MTEVPINPEVGLRLVIEGVGTITVKDTPLLATPPTVTITLPVVAPPGTGAVMLVALQAVGVAAVPLNLTVLAPWEAPKLVPVMMTEVPTGPDVGLRLVMLGRGTVTVNVTPLLAVPPTVTTTLPVVAPVGTGTAMLVALQLVGIAGVPLNVTVLVPWLAPKFVPVIVTEVPTTPEVGFRFVIEGPVVPPPLAALKAASAAPHLSETLRLAVAEAVPAVDWIWSSVTSLAFEAPGMVSLTT